VSLLIKKLRKYKEKIIEEETFRIQKELQLDPDFLDKKTIKILVKMGFIIEIFKPLLTRNTVDDSTATGLCAEFILKLARQKRRKHQKVDKIQ